MLQRRHTRSSSAPETSSARRDSVPATYGLGATVPSRGFLPDPERLLRRQRTLRPRRQVTQTGIDAIMKALVDFTLASPPIIDKKPDDTVEGDGEYVEGEEDFRPGGQEIVRDDGRAVEGDVEEDEGYEKWGLPQTPAHVEEEEEDIFPLATLEEGYTRVQIFPSFLGGEDEASEVHDVPAPEAPFSEDTADSLPNPSSPPTMPESVYDTPIQSPPRQTTAQPPPSWTHRRGSEPSTSTVALREQASHSVVVLPHRYRRPLYSAPRLLFVPQSSCSDSDNRPETSPAGLRPLLSYSPLTSSASQPTPATLGLTSPSSASTNPEPSLSDSHVASSNDEPPAAPHSHNDNGFDDESEDEEDSESESEDPDDDEQDFEGSDIKRYYFRVPRSTEECSRKYNQVQPLLEEFLDQRYESFFVLLLVSCYGNDKEVIEIPHIYIGIPRGEDSFPPLQEFPTELHETGLGIALCRMRIDWDSAEKSNRKLPFQELRTGISVGYGEKDTATLGAIIQKSDGTFLGITSGHLLNKDSTDTNITQPGLNDLILQLNKLRKKSREWEFDVNEAKTSEQRDLATIEKVKIDMSIAEAERFVGPTPAETATKIKAGTIVKRELKRIKHGNRHCLSDFLLFEIDKSRAPTKLDPWSFTPPEDGELGQGHWRMSREWGEVSFDAHVRKNGAITEFTYGFVAGVRTSWKVPRFKDPVSEFYCLEEQDVTNHRFSKQGDSGAGLIDKDGMLVGFVMASSTVEDFELVVHPVTAIPDLKTIKRCQLPDGSVNKEGRVWFQAFSQVTMTIITCASVIEKRVGIKGAGSLFLDC